MIKRRHLLSENILDFARFLRTKDQFIVDGQVMTEALQAIQYIPIGNDTTFRFTLKSLFCKTRAQWLNFDEYFTTYWRELHRALDSKIKDGELERKGLTRNRVYSIQDIKSWLYQNDEEEDVERLDASISGSFASDETTNIPKATEFEEISQLVKKWLDQLHNLPARRKVKHRSKGTLYLRKVMEAMAKGKEFQLEYRRPKQKQYHMVVLFDASRSMSMYQSFYIALVRSIFQQFPKVYSYGFHTELFPTDTMFTQYTYDQTVSHLERVRGLYTSGTKIGLSLQEYLDKYASEQINGRTIFLIISDGWDTGDVEILSKALEGIRYKCKQIIWLNPSTAIGDQLPAGLVAADEWVDDLASVYSVESLMDWVG